MPGLNQLELARTWASVGNRSERFLEVISYVRMLRGAEFPASYVPTAGLAQAFALSAAGEEVLAWLMREIGDINSDSARLAVAMYFSHDDLYVDVEAVNVPDLHAALAAEMADGQVSFPQEYGRTLYDRFFDAFPGRTSSLSYEETLRLIEGTPPGSYHVGRLTVGPLGPATSVAFRDFPPTRSAPLWHCSDPGCAKLHTVRLEPAPTGTRTAIEAIGRRCQERRLMRSEWDALFRTLSSAERQYYSDYAMPQFPWLLADGFVATELQAVIRQAFATDPTGARRNLAAVTDVKRGSEEIISSLPPHAELQCLLMMEEQLVGRALEAAVLRGEIQVPTTEVRRPVAFRPGGTWWNLLPEVSSLGLRNVSRKPDFPILRLQKLIAHVGTRGGDPEALEWELRFAEGATVAEKLASTIQQSPPRQVLRRFVLSSAAALAACVEFLQPMYLERPSNEEEEERFLDRVLWKLGFPVTRHPSELQTFWRRDGALRATLTKRQSEMANEWEETVRGAAVNYFVSLEDLFDRALSFTGWALLHDHYADQEAQQFAFNLEDARRFTAEMLNSNGTAETLRPDGQNTLWPLIYNLKFLSEVLEKLSSSPEEARLRSPSELPEFVALRAAPFPFPSRLPLHDLEPGSLRQVIDLLAEVSTGLARIDLPNLRNRLEHKRPDADFPSESEIEQGLELVATSISKFEHAGLLPVLLVQESETRDQYNRVRLVLRDYAGRPYEVSAPTGSRHGRMPSWELPQVVLKLARLREIPDALRFTLSEDSPYRTAWQHYPRRRLRVAAGVPTTAADEGEDAGPDLAT